MSNNEEYLGDGLYVSFDGWQWKLRAPRLGGDHEVYLDDRMVADFEKYRDRQKAEQLLNWNKAKEVISSPDRPVEDREEDLGEPDHSGPSPGLPRE